MKNRSYYSMLVRDSGKLDMVSVVCAGAGFSFVFAEKI